MHAKSSKDNYTSCDLFEHVFGPKQFSVTSDSLRAYLNLLSVNFKYYLPVAVVKHVVHLCVIRGFIIWYLFLFMVSGGFEEVLQDIWPRVCCRFGLRWPYQAGKGVPGGGRCVPALGPRRHGVHSWCFSSSVIPVLMQCAIWLSS